MKKTIITVLKFLKEYVEIEAIEQTKDNQKCNACSLTGS